MEIKMTIFKKGAVAFAAVSMVAAPVAASAAPIADLRAVSAAEDANEIEGSSWIVILFALAAVIGGVIAISDGSSNAPTSP
jgi:hypothetical protein